MRSRLARLPADDGMSLIEVVIALFVFAIISTGVVAGTMTMNRITADSRSREIATNLAEQDLDAARATADPFDVASASTAQTVSGRTYTVSRVATWASAGGAGLSCGSGVDYSFRRVATSVTWSGQLTTTPAVHSETILAPASRTASGNGAISVRVTGADGTARQGVSVTVSPISGGAALAQQPSPTDGDGCAFARVAPGTYKIQLTATGFVDPLQAASPSTSTAVVAAGGTYGWSVRYDASGTFTTTYAGNFTPPGSASVMLPTNLETTFLPGVSTEKVSVTPQVASSVHLFPLPSGYTAVAGGFATTDAATTCASMDPAAWDEGSVGSAQMAQGTRAAAVAGAGQTSAFATGSAATIPMGVVRVTSLPALSYLTAVSATATGTGNPGCATGHTYTFGSVPLNGTAYIALPYGSWTIYSSLTVGLLTTQVLSNQLAIQTNNDTNGVTSGGGVVVTTLDPRSVY